MKHVNKFLVLMLLVLSWTVEAQIQELTRLSETVVQGEVISSVSKWNDQRNLILTENKILVKSVFKGNIQDSVISVLTTGGIVDEHFHYKTHEINMTEGEKGYFFLTPNYVTNSNDFSDERYGFVRLHGNQNKFISVFGIKRSINDFEEQIIKETKFPKIDLEKHHEIFSVKAFGKLDTCDILPLTRNAKSIEFTFDSVSYTPDFKYLEFDIMAKVNTPGLKFGKGDLFIKYDKAFGEDIVTKGTVEITKGKIIKNSLYDLEYGDYSTNSVFVTADSEFGSNQMNTFTSSAEQLFHVKVKIDDFSQIGTISFDSIDISGSVYYWCKGEYLLFDQVNLDDPITAVNSQEGSEIGITYTFENLSVNQSNTEMSVELFAEATNTSLYSDAFIYINYNELGFGSNVVTNGTFSFQQQDLLDDPNVYQVFLSDNDQNTIKLVVFAPSENGLSTLSSIPRKLGTLTFQIIDCEEEKNLHFDLTETSDHTHYTGAMPIPWELYDPVIANDEEKGKICGCTKPVITSFSPSIIHAGTGEILTITGQNFGNWDQLNCTVLFPNGDDGGSTMMEAGSKDFEWNNVIHWSDTEIQIKVPSTDKNQGADNPASTGKIQVKNECEISDKSSQSLQIPYAIMNARASQLSTPFKMTIQENSSSGICFQFTDDTPGWIIDQFEIALKSWCNETGINFSIGSSVNSNEDVGEDGINIVKYGGQSSTVGGGMVINEIFYSPTCNSNEVGWPFSEIDFILYGRDVIVPTNDEIQEMREIVRHELGHSHMLAHSNSGGPSNQYLMCYTGNLNGNITSSDSDGANLVFGNSQAIVPNCGTPIGNGNCGGSCSTNATYDISSSFNILLTPNPSMGIVDLSIESKDKVKIDFIEVLNINGVIVKRFDLKSTYQKTSIDLPNQSGIYIVKIYTNNSCAMTKVIRI